MCRAPVRRVAPRMNCDNDGHSSRDAHENFARKRCFSICKLISHGRLHFGVKRRHFPSMALVSTPMSHACQSLHIELTLECADCTLRDNDETPVSFCASQPHLLLAVRYIVCGLAVAARERTGRSLGYHSRDQMTLL